MLEAQQERQNNRHPVIQSKEGSSLSRLLHERKIGLEEETYNH